MRHFAFALETGSKCLNALDNTSGGPDRDRTDDLLHAMQARISTVSNLISNLVIFQLVEWTFTSFTSFTWFHKTIGGNLGETSNTFFGPITGNIDLSIAHFGPKFKAISFFTTSTKTTSRQSLGEGFIYGEHKCLV